MRVRAWNPALPQGKLEKIYLHWSGGDYTTLYPAYHFCVASLDGADPHVFATHPLEANMRDLRADPDVSYAAHTRGRNSFAVGLSIMSMREAVPSNFGPYPLTEELIDGLCRVAKVLADFYRIAVGAETIMTHAEAACIDGYFGSGEEERWDIARLQPSQRALVASDALAVGGILRAKIENY